MNGVQQAAKGASVHQDDPTAGAANGGVSSLNKKRKKDGLKPIITTENANSA